jgi:hypothetical protein
MEGRWKLPDIGPERLTSEKETAKTIRSLVAEMAFKDSRLLDCCAGKNLSQMVGDEGNLGSDGDSSRMLEQPSYRHFRRFFSR